MITEGKYYRYTGPDFPGEVVEVYTYDNESTVCTVLRSDGSVWSVFTDRLEEVPKVKQPSMTLPTDAQERKKIPIVSGVLDYFPLAIAEIAKCSLNSNEQHNPGQELHWDRTKSTDHVDCIGRHLIDRGKFDTDGQRHSAKLAWRALANLEIELEEAKKKGN